MMKFALLALTATGALAFAATSAEARDNHQTSRYSYGHQRYHDGLEHRDFHRYQDHRNAHRYPMTGRQHGQLHDNLGHDRYHDQLQHRQYHRNRSYSPYRSGYGNQSGFSFRFGR